MARLFLPSMSALTAFESAARHLSFSRAANELHLTQGAVSRQIRQLEDELGLDLFERVNQRVFLTDGGRSYYKDVQKLLGQLSAATEQVMATAGSSEVLNLAVLPTFAARWLLPRIKGFMDLYPGATINFSVRAEPFSFSDEPLDAAIHHGEATWPGAICEPLCPEAVLPVAAPGLIEANAIVRPEDILAVPLLHQTTRPSAWRDWLELAGAPTALAFRGPRFDQFAMIAEAAVVGMGAALMPRFLIEEELKSGKLKVLFDQPLNSGTSYWYVYPEAKAGSRIVRTFGDWLRDISAPQELR